MWGLLSESIPSFLANRRQVLRNPCSLDAEVVVGRAGAAVQQVDALQNALEGRGGSGFGALGLGLKIRRDP